MSEARANAEALYRRARETADRAGIRTALPEVLPALAPDPDAPLVLVADGVERSIRGQSQRVADNNLVLILPGAHLDRCTIGVRGRGNVVVVGPDARLKQVHLLSSGRGGTTVIGGRTTWASGSAMCGGWDDPVNIVVGADCMFSNSVVLRTSDSHGIFDAASQERLNDPGDIAVHEHVWMGSGARASKGATIGANAVVGQLSLATGNLEPGGLYAGVPAKLLRSGVTWSRTPSWDGIPDEYVAHPDAPSKAPERR